MLQFRHKLMILTFGIGLGACFQVSTKSVGRVTVLDSSARPVQAKQMTDEKSAATMDPNSKTPQLLTASSTGRLAGSSITMQPGSLAFAAELVVEEASPLGETSLVSELGLTDTVTVQNVGAGMIIRPTEGVSLSQPMTISMPIPLTSGLRLQSTQNLAVFYKQFIGDTLVSGIIPGDKIGINSDGTCFFTGYFGAYWVATVAEAVTVAVVVKSEEPIVNAQKVSVIEKTGVVSETTIVAKAEIPAVSWGATTIAFDEASRSVRLSAALSSPQTLSACKADLMTSVTASSGVVVEAGSTPSIYHKILKAEAHTLLGRFRCIDEQGRQTTSAFSSSIEVPLLKQSLPPVSWVSVEVGFSASDRIVSLSATTKEVRKLSACKARFQKNLVEPDNIEVDTGSSLLAKIPADFDEGTPIIGRFTCTDEEGRISVSPWSASFDVPPNPNAPLVSWGPTSLTMSPMGRSVDLKGSVSSALLFKSCTALFYPSTSAASGIEINTGSVPHTTYVPVNSAAHSLVGRYRCTDMQNRITLSPWSAPLSIPDAFGTQLGQGISWNATSLLFNAASRTLTLQAYMNGGSMLSQCRAVIKASPTATVELASFDTGSNLNIQFAAISSSAHAVVGQFLCKDSSNNNTASPWSAAINVPDASNTVMNPLPTRPDYCGSSPAPNLYTSNGTSAPAIYTNFNDISTCHYQLRIFASQAVQIAVATGDRSYSCGRSTHDLLADGSQQGLTCRSSNAGDFFNEAMALPRGNYEINLTFTPGSDLAQISAHLIPCSLGSLHMLTASAYSAPTFGTPDASTLMTHYGACEFSAVSPSFSMYPGHFRFVNGAGDTFCGSANTLAPNSIQTGSCGITPTQFSSSTYLSGSYRVNVRYGLSYDPSGAVTNVFEMKNEKEVNCNDNFYLFGPTAAGNTAMTLNKFVRNGNGTCEFNVNWLADAGTGPNGYDFKVGNGAGSVLCGTSYNDGYTYSPVYRSLDCSPAALAMNTSLIQNGHFYRFKLILDESTGAPVNVYVYDETPVCNEVFYLQNQAAFGFVKDPRRIMHEVQECLYEYKWTPQNNQDFSLISDDMNKTCGASSQPSVGSAPVDAACVTGFTSAQPNAILPIGFTPGSSYTVQLDFRNSYNNAPPKLKVAPHIPANDCPEDYYLTGPVSGNTLDPATNKFKRISACHFQFMLTPSSSGGGYHRVVNTAGTEACGYNNYVYPMGPSEASKILDCSGAYPDINLNSLTQNHSYRLDLTLDGNTKKFSLIDTTPSCYSGSLFLAGAAGAAIGTNALKTFSSPSQCKFELMWTPVAGSLPFTIEGSSYVTSCGGTPGSNSVTAGAGPQNILCNVRDINLATPIVPLNVVPGQTYRISLDRTRDHLAPLLTISPITATFAAPGFAWERGSAYTDMGGNMGTLGTAASSNDPSNRTNAATWRDASGHLWLYGGEETGGNFRADLWKYDPASAMWTWIAGPSASNDYGDYTAQNANTFVERPSARRGSVSWFDPSTQKLWLFGGYGVASDGAYGRLSDLWSFDPASGRWNWVKGSKYANDPGSYGTLGVSSSTDMPAGREEAVAWVALGKLWLFGGYASMSSGNGATNDLWRFDPTSGDWTWVDGSSVHGVAPTGSNPGALHAMASWGRSDGSLWIFGGSRANGTFSNDLWRFDTDSSVWGLVRSGAVLQGNWGTPGVMEASVEPSARRSARSWIDTSGRLWMIGGSGYDAVQNNGLLNDIWVYDTGFSQWARMGGTTYIGSFGTYYAAGSGPQAGQGIGARSDAAVWSNGSGGAYIFGGYGRGSYQQGFLGDLWQIIP